VNGLEGILPFVLIAAVFWFLLIRPQRKRQMELANTQRSIGVGDEVMLGAGIVGRVASADDEFVQLEISPGVQMRVARGAVVRNLTPTAPPTDVTDLPDEPAGPARDS
jgi:preprotein translocase subunit YajC